ncbi:hypothetical protein [Pseudoalteromonas sp. Angola-7]|jgi:hypothetical protein|uniref:hypothetical protein n=1 Tax=Alteromonadales TaxID=135622 RepID=UPI00235872FD|nr:hypothetical protein [Pseudoalteromonas sp. Angola-7]MDC9531845.1 hypothetical protein [Pseudoalteromonas sp. Angola-7]
MWNSIENGSTIGEYGSEGGEIIRDIEHIQGARLTLEKNTTIAPFAITSGVYGCFFHTTFLGNIEEANEILEKMKTDISNYLAAQMENEEQYKWIENFVANY